MELFIVRVDGLDIAISDSEPAAHACARRHGAEESGLDVRILRIEDGVPYSIVPPIPPAEAVSAA